MGHGEFIQGYQMDRVRILLCLVVLALVKGQENQLDREGKKLVLKKVRKLRPDADQEQLGQCPETVGVQLYEDPSSCNRFYKCEDGVASAEVCANGLLFDQAMALTDAIHNYCVYNWKADCGARQADNTPQSSPGCEYQYGLFPLGDGCQSSYVKCEAGVPSEMPCEAENPNVPVVLGLAYDPAMHSCNWPDLLLDLGCDPSERLGGFQCPVLKGQSMLCAIVVLYHIFFRFGGII